MARRSKRYSQNEISSLINSNSESSDSEHVETVKNQEKQNASNFAKRSSLRIKLRRSTSDSMYKIDRCSRDGIHETPERDLISTPKRSERLQSKLQRKVQERNVTTITLNDDDTSIEILDTPLKEATQKYHELGNASKCTYDKSTIRKKNLFNVQSNSKENEPCKKSVESSDDKKGRSNSHKEQSGNCRTPLLGKRYSVIKKPATPLQEARTRLHVSYVPKSLPCREKEFNDIFQFLRRKLVDRTGGCIYISGVPGTGKTATVKEAVRCLQKFVKKGEINDFNYIEINAMKLSEPRQIYVQMLKQLSGNSIGWEQAYHVLEKKFQHSGRKTATNDLEMTLLLVDELDILCTKRQDVVYNILDWPTKLSAHLVVITIANTMDLPERLLMGRVTSRLGLTRLTFQPYNYKQLQEIVSTRLNSNSVDSFKNEAIQLVARKVSAVSGDARRALDICRRATEIAESYGSNMVSIQHVNEAVSEMIATAKVQAIKHCSDMEKIFLQAVCAEITRIGIEETCFKNVYIQFESLCSFDGIKIPTITESLAICARLGASRLLICEHSKSDIYQRILLNVSTDDIHYALQKLDTLETS